MVGGRSTIGDIRISESMKHESRLGGAASEKRAERDPRPPSCTGGTKIARSGALSSYRYVSSNEHSRQARCAERNPQIPRSAQPACGHGSRCRVRAFPARAQCGCRRRTRRAAPRGGSVRRPTSPPKPLTYSGELDLDIPAAGDDDATRQRGQVEAPRSRDPMLDARDVRRSQMSAEHIHMFRTADLQPAVI